MLSRIWQFGLMVWLALAGALMVTAVQAQEGDPPGRVGRLAEATGQVWFYSPDAGDWVAAPRNQPLTNGDRLATDSGARAELQIGSTTVRLDGGSELEVLALDDQRVELQLHSGNGMVRVRSNESAREFSLTTADGRFLTEQPGRYRFDRLDNASAVTVYAGQARYEGERSALAVPAGQRAEFWIDTAGVAQYNMAQPVRDEFVAWNDDRDARDAAPVTSRYISPEMTGAQDLDRYGDWEQTPEYGAVWTPREVASDWTPYSHGHWAYVRPWGWTWVDDAPWGFAPFHYGRWVYARRGWGWVPGVRVARPVYAPALVAWVGGRNVDVSVSIGGGGPTVGWFPLAPRDVYVPSYRYSPRYVREVNITNVTNVTQINNFVNLPPERREFGNRRFPHAVTVVPASVVTGRQPVAPVAARWRERSGSRDNEPVMRAGPALFAPPIAAPALPTRAIDPRTVRPPGFARNEQRDAGRPGGRDIAGGRPLPTDDRSSLGRGPNGVRNDVDRPGARPSLGNEGPPRRGFSGTGDEPARVRGTGDEPARVRGTGDEPARVRGAGDEPLRPRGTGDEPAGVLGVRPAQPALRPGDNGRPGGSAIERPEVRPALPTVRPARPDDATPRPPAGVRPSTSDDRRPSPGAGNNNGNDRPPGVLGRGARGDDDNRPPPRAAVSPSTSDREDRRTMPALRPPTSEERRAQPVRQESRDDDDRPSASRNTQRSEPRAQPQPRPEVERAQPREVKAQPRPEPREARAEPPPRREAPQAGNKPESSGGSRGKSDDRRGGPPQQER